MGESSPPIYQLLCEDNTFFLFLINFLKDIVLICVTGRVNLSSSSQEALVSNILSVHQHKHAKCLAALTETSWQLYFGIYLKTDVSCFPFGEVLEGRGICFI